MRILLPFILFLVSLASFGQQITVMVAPFDTSRSEDREVGKKVGIILNLQVWQTLRIPATGPGHRTQGGVTWDISSAPPASYVEAEQLARSQTENSPQLVLWGKAWHYGEGNVVEAFLLVRDSAMQVRDQRGLWTVVAPDGPVFAVGTPRRQIEFAPIVLRADLLPELRDPAGLKLYRSPEGNGILGSVGNYFIARQQSGDTALVELPSHERGWIRLPDLSTTHSEVVDFCGALVRILRQDWNGAQQLFRRVVTYPNTPTAIRIDSYLYLAIAAANAGEDAYPWVKQAYELDPYSRTTVQFLCMSHLASITRMSEVERRGEAGRRRLSLLREAVNRNERLFPPHDPWLDGLKAYLDKSF